MQLTIDNELDLAYPLTALHLAHCHVTTPLTESDEMSSKSLIATGSLHS
jgi:hypothetical protein